MYTRENKGFTLIELLVVISIISLLSSIVMASLSSARNKAQVTKVMQEIRQFQIAMEQYKLGGGNYSASGFYVQAYTKGTGGGDNMTPFINAMAPYMKVDKLFFTQVDTDFHLNYLGGGTCGIDPMPADGYSVIFSISSYPNMRFPELKTWSGSSNYYCFLSI